MAQKPHLNIVFIGHVDHGKSTTVGRLLVDTGVIRKEEIEKFRLEAEAKGKATFEFAWVMDDLKEERERGVTLWDVASRKSVRSWPLRRFWPAPSATASFRNARPSSSPTPACRSPNASPWRGR